MARAGYNQERPPQLGLARAAAPARSATAAAAVDTGSGRGPRRRWAGSVLSLVGRRTQLSEVITKLAQGPGLVTVLGPGGIGKTRLAQGVIESKKLDFPTVFCDLREASSIREVSHQIAEALGLRWTCAPAVASPAAQLRDALSRIEPRVVVLDNFEHLTNLATDTLGQWLPPATQIRWLVTSRRILHLQSEQVVELGPLPLPSSDEDWECPSIQLFAEGAARVEPSFDVRDHGPHVGALVRRLEGIPLALELAAGQMRRAGPRDLLERLGPRVILLRSADRDANPRHQTLRAAIDSSWGLLTRDEQATLRQLTVFRGGFTLEAARAVVRLGPTAEKAVDDVIGDLRDASLLSAVAESDGSGRHRWDMLRATREYAEEQWDPTGSHRRVYEDLRRRHAEAFASDAARYAPSPGVISNREARSRLQADLENLRSALGYYVETATGAEASRIDHLGATIHALVVPYAPLLAVAVLSEALDGMAAGSTTADPSVLATMTGFQILCAQAYRRAGDYPAATSYLHRSADGAAKQRLLGIRWHLERGITRMKMGDPAGSRHDLEWALAKAREVANPHLEARVRSELAYVLADVYRDRGALDHWLRAIPMFRRCRDQQGALRARVQLWNYRVRLMVGGGDANLTEIRALREEAAAMQERWLEASTWLGEGHVHQLHRRFDVATACYERAHAIDAEAGLRYQGACAQVHAGMANASQKALSRAIALCGAALATFREIEAGRVTGFAALQSGIAYACAGDARGARAAFAEAGEWLERSNDEWFLRVCRLGDGFVAYALRTQHLAAGDEPTSIALRTTVATTLEEAERDDLPRRCLTAHLACELLREFLSEQDAGSLPIRIWDDGTGFQIGDEEAISFGDGRVLGRTLLALAKSRLDSHAQPLDFADLLAAGWPGETVSEDAASLRVRNAIARLRKAGLAHVVRKRREGYYLDSSVPVVIVAKPGRTL